MPRILADRKYLESHLWFLPDSSDPTEGRVGVTDDLQLRLGDLIAVELPREGASLTPEDAFVYIEGLLDVAEIPALPGMQIIRTNPKLEINPDLVNRDPYGAGFLAHSRLGGTPRFMEGPEYADYLENGSVGQGA
jgi:glycine cleavage system H protein